ncbi:MAG: glycoside hydrolase family 36 protein, partial [Bacteroidota bacterium]
MKLNIRYELNDMKVVSVNDMIHLSSWSLASEYRVNGKVVIFDVEPVVAKGKKGFPEIVCTDEVCKLNLQLEPADGGVRFRCHVENLSGSIINMERIRFTPGTIKIGDGKGRSRFFTNGYQSWSETRSFKENQKEMVSLLPSMVILQDNPRNLPSKTAGEFTSDMFAVISSHDYKSNILVGQGAPFKQFLYIRYNSNIHTSGTPNLQLEIDFGGMTLYPDKKIECDEIYIKADEDPNKLQDWYFKKIAVDNAKKQSLPGGWCSWYYYFTGITEKDIYENLDAMRQHDVNWKYFVLDDGYQTAVGDWLSINKKFPGGLKKVAQHISEFGMVPGIWMAPFIARRNSRLYKEHKDWFLTDRKGKPVKAGWNPNWGIGGNFYALDTTNPQFQDYLGNVVHTMVHEWGFKYLKLDFTYAASLYGSAFNQTLSSAERLTHGYHLIRRAAGKDVVILGCGSPLSPAIGHVDA